MKKEKIPWVFWVSIKKRDWFCNFWVNRYSNSICIQIYKIHISIGMPWHKKVVEYYKEKFNDFNSITNTNKTFNKWHHIHINRKSANV